MIFLLLCQLYSADPTVSFCRSESDITFTRSYLPGLRKTLIVAALLITTLLLPTDVHAGKTVVKVDDCNNFDRALQTGLGKLPEDHFFCQSNSNNIYYYDVDKVSYPHKNFQNRHELKLKIIEAVNGWNRVHGTYIPSEHFELWL